jgi:hypothetical protein
VHAASLCQSQSESVHDRGLTPIVQAAASVTAGSP